jgi:hypothetical protein
VPILLGVGGCLTVLCIAAVIIGVVLFMRNNPDLVSVTGSTPQALITQIVVPNTQPRPTQVPTVAPLPTEPPAATQSVQEQPTTPPQADTPASQPAVWPADIGQVLTDAYFMDDFSSAKFEWAYADDEIRQWARQDGHYSLNLKADDYTIWAYLPVEFVPTTVAFDAAVLEGSDQGAYGVICHYQDAENYHYIALDPYSAEYSIGYVVGDEYNSLLDEHWMATQNLRPGAYSVNHFEVVCYRDSITLLINDTFETTVNFEPATAGDTAIFGETWEDTNGGGLKVLIDNLSAFKLE